MAVKQLNYKNKLFDISYEILNPMREDVIVFLHGWGSNKDIMKQAFGNYLPNFKHIYIDMPGFGKSNNEMVLTTIDYANIVREFILNLDINISEITVIGHSFGGKVATLLKPKKLVLLSTAGILEQKPYGVLLKIRIVKIFNKFGLGKVSKLLRSKDVNMMSEVMYEIFKNVVDEDFSKEFAKYKGETFIYWGDNDTKTSLHSGKIVHLLIKNSTFKSYDGTHEFFFKYAKDIANGIS